MKNFIKALVKSGCVTRLDNFGGEPIPPIRRPWVVGTIITVPEDYQVYLQKTPKGGFYFVPVFVLFPDGDYIVDRITPNTLFKAVTTVDNRYFRTQGTVVDAVRQYSNLDDAFSEVLAGRTFKVTKNIECEVQNPITHEHRITHVYHFDFVYPLAA